jgi:hypothetical protein
MAQMGHHFLAKLWSSQTQENTLPSFRTHSLKLSQACCPKLKAYVGPRGGLDPKVSWARTIM